MLIHTAFYHRMQVTMRELIQIAKDLPDRTQNSELRILFDIIHVQLIETNSVGSLLL